MATVTNMPTSWVCWASEDFRLQGWPGDCVTDKSYPGAPEDGGGTLELDFDVLLFAQ